MNKIKIDAHIKASQEKVWEYYTNAKHIVHWNFATEDWSCPNANVELVGGGKYHARMEAKDGSFGFDFEAIIRDVQPFEKLSYTMFGDRKVEILLNKTEHGTYISLEFEAETENPIEMQQAGWQAILNNFKKYVETIES
jgi:uncharacterized protein YndB with AHSA1/START domain